MAEFHSRYYNSKPFPPLPKWIEDRVLSPDIKDQKNWVNYFDNKHANREVVKTDGSKVLSQVLKRYKVDEDVWAWVKENIHDDIIDCGVTISDFKDRPTMGAHTDKTRNFTLIYLLDTGGPNAETTFWQEVDQPLIREPGTVPPDFNRLTRLDSVVIPERHWILLDARVLHSIEGIVGTRTAFQVSLDYEI